MCDAQTMDVQYCWTNTDRQFGEMFLCNSYTDRKLTNNKQNEAPSPSKQVIMMEKLVQIDAFTTPKSKFTIHKVLQSTWICLK